MFRDKIVHILGQALLAALDCWPPEPPLFRIFSVEESISCMPGLATKQENFRFLRNQVSLKFPLMADLLLPTSDKAVDGYAMPCPKQKSGTTDQHIPYLHDVCHNW